MNYDITFIRCAILPLIIIFILLVIASTYKRYRKRIIKKKLNILKMHAKCMKDELRNDTELAKVKINDLYGKAEILIECANNNYTMGNDKIEVLLEIDKIKKEIQYILQDMMNKRNEYRDIISEEAIKIIKKMY